jgi:hypothetical protein
MIQLNALKYSYSSKDVHFDDLDCYLKYNRVHQNAIHNEIMYNLFLLQKFGNFCLYKPLYWGFVAFQLLNPKALVRTP